jgi:hypothetical protein
MMRTSASTGEDTSRVDPSESTDRTLCSIFTGDARGPWNDYRSVSDIIKRLGALDTLGDDGDAFNSEDSVIKKQKKYIPNVKNLY